MLEEGTIRNKINNLIDNVTNNNVEKLILKLVEDDQLLDIVTKYVSQLDSETINKLPTSVAKYAVTTFNKDTAGAYKDNVEFLILVLKHGDASQKKEVVRLMKDKIINEDDLDTVVKVLDHLVTDNKKMLENLVGELEEVKNSEKVEEVTKERISELIKKLSSLQKK
ncbi:MAG: hypothetical protein IK131_12805 [Paludibacteraceae bacterium]|nr:hypothetical protein [Paludibacteraceae bacterium]